MSLEIENAYIAYVAGVAELRDEEVVISADSMFTHTVKFLDGLDHYYCSTYRFKLPHRKTWYKNGKEYLHSSFVYIPGCDDDIERSRVEFNFYGEINFNIRINVTKAQIAENGFDHYIMLVKKRMAELW